MFSCEFCEIFKNTYFYRAPVAASEFSEFQLLEILKHRSSRPIVFCKKSVLKNLVKFTRKHLCQSLFLTKVPLLGLAPCRCFYFDFAKLLRTPFCIEHLWWLLLKTLLQNTYQHLIYDRDCFEIQKFNKMW